MMKSAVMGIFVTMGISVLLYLFLTGAFLDGESKTAWENALKTPLEDVGIQVENFALFVAVSLIFGLSIFIPLTVYAVRMLT